MWIHTVSQSYLKYHCYYWDEIITKRNFLTLHWNVFSYKQKIQALKSSWFEVFYLQNLKIPLRIERLPSRANCSIDHNSFFHILVNTWCFDRNVFKYYIWNDQLNELIFIFRSVATLISMKEELLFSLCKLQN